MALKLTHSLIPLSHWTKTSLAPSNIWLPIFSGKGYSRHSFQGHVTLQVVTSASSFPSRCYEARCKMVLRILPCRISHSSPTTDRQTLHTHSFQTPPSPSSPPHLGILGMRKCWSPNIRLENYPRTNLKAKWGRWQLMRASCSLLHSHGRKGEKTKERESEDDAAAMEAGFTAIKKRPQGVSVSHSLSLLLWCVV